MTEEEIDPRWVGRGFVQHLAFCFLDNVTSETRAPVRYQVPPFRAGLTDLFNLPLCSVINYFIISCIARLSTECFLLTYWKFSSF